MYRIARGRKLPPAARVARMLRLFGSSLHSPYGSSLVLIGVLWGLGECSDLQGYDVLACSLLDSSRYCAEQQLLTCRVNTSVAASLSFVPGIPGAEGAAGQRLGWHGWRSRCAPAARSDRHRHLCFLGQVMELVLHCCRA